MEQPEIVENIEPKQEGEQVEIGGHAEAVAFFEQHRDFFEHYAKGRVKIEPAPAGVATFAFDLEKNTVYINSMFYQGRGFSQEKTLFAILHEIEHFLEKKAMLAENGGEKRFENYLERIKKSKAFSLMDNCAGDIRENRTVVQRTNKGMGELETKLYKEDLFVETDFTAQPRHIQFSQALLREARVPDEECGVAEEVRKALDEVKQVEGLLEIMTNPEIPMSTRLKLQDKYLWPKVEALLEQDLEDRKKKKQAEKEEQEKAEKERSEGSEGEEGGESDEGEGEDQTGQGEQENSGDEKKEGKNGGESGEEEGEEGETDPNKIFAADYAEAEKNFPEAMPIEEIEKAFKEWKEAQSGKDSADKADEAYAEKIGVEKADLQNYRKIVAALDKITNPETNVGIVEELKNLFTRIIAKRLKQAAAPKYPVDEGDELVDPALLVAEVRAGNLQPKVWEDTEIKEKKGDRFGEVEITLVCDRSGSMKEGGKAEQQRKAAVLVMEALKEFADLCEAERINVDKPLQVQSEIYGFGAGEDGVPMKRMSAELGEAERIGVWKKLHNLPGSTTDFNSLEAINVGLSEESKTKMREGELKKIVIVFTDGGSDNPALAQEELKSLRTSGVVVVGVGITKAGAPVLSTYAPEALVVEEVANLPLVLGNLLKEHLKDI